MDLVAPPPVRSVDLLPRQMRRFVVEATGCWRWIGSLTTAGYGHISIRNRYHQAHRVLYERLVGPIRDGLQLDHLCRNTRCVNPAHLEPVTARENIRRGTSPIALSMAKNACLNGHPLVPGNLRRIRSYPRRRDCLTCHNARSAAYKARRRTAA